jgi:hypothetical protein
MLRGSARLRVKSVLFLAFLVALACPAVLAQEGTDEDQDGFTVEAGDCDDRDPEVHPGAPERCNGVDDDCNGTTDEGNPEGGNTCATGLPGLCATGHTRCSEGSLACVATLALPEVCEGGLDEDCDGLADAEDPDCAVSCPDGDGDGFAVCGGGCQLPSGKSCGDCDDARPGVNPDAAESCNDRDDDCDGQTDEGNPGGGASCSTGQQGVCAAGTRTCVDGALVCLRDDAPSPEVC